LASFGTGLAVIVVVLRAFVVALLANFDALTHDVRGVGRVAGDVRGREPTDIGTVAVEPDAGYHHFDVFFVEAGIGAKLAGSDATGQGSKYILVFSGSVFHNVCGETRKPTKLSANALYVVRGRITV
jgi:hypothetical protein